jgi:hypothetical protein
MKWTVVFLVLIFFNDHVTAQDNVETIAINNSSVNTLILGEKGFIIKIRSNKTIQLRRYNSQAKLLWKLEIDNAYPYKVVDAYASRVDDGILIASPSSNTTYLIQIKDLGARKGYWHLTGDGIGYFQSTHIITRIDSSGIAKTYELKGSLELGRSLQTVFCDDQFLYYLATENGNEGEKENRATEKLILNRFDALDLSYKKVFLDLPQIIDDDKSTFWTYLGDIDGKKFIASKYLNRFTTANSFHVAVFNSEGTIENKFAIDFDLINGYIRPTRFFRRHRPGFAQIRDLDFLERRGYPYWRASGTIDQPGAYANLILNTESRQFYVIGTYGPKPFRFATFSYSGFYIYKYDPAGNRLMKTMLAESFRSKCMPADRHIMIKFLPNEAINLSFLNTINNDFAGTEKKEFFDYMINSNGDVELKTKDSDFQDLRSDMRLDLSEQSKSYIAQMDSEISKTSEFENSFCRNGEILLERNYRYGFLKIAYFKKNGPK